MNTVLVQPEEWEPIGSSVNAAYYVSAGAADIVLVVPAPGSSDDGPSALENVAFQMSYARSLGRPCAFIVALTRLRSQDSDARREYARGMDPKLCYASALVVDDVLSRAIASFFLGISKPLTVTRIFDSIPAAHAWAESLRPEIR